MGKSGVRLRVLILSTVFAYFFIQPASANQIAEVSEFKLEYFLPMLIAFAIAIPAWRWFIPNQLANLQVAVESMMICMKFIKSQVVSQMRVIF